MKYTVNDIRREYNRLDDLMDVDTTNIRITVSTRAVKRLGQCVFKSGKPIEINITDFVMDCEDQFWDTIRHEYAHAAVAIRTGRNQGHNDAWKAVCRKVGCDPERLTKLDGELKRKVEESGRRRQYKWEMRCGICGRTWKYKTAGKFVRMVQQGRGGNLRCPCGDSDFHVYEI